MARNRLWCIVLTAILLFTSAFSSIAGEQKIQVKIGDQFIEFPDQEPVLDGDRVLVPMRAIFEKLGVSVDWNEAAGTVTAANGKISVSLKLDSMSASVNGKELSLDVPAKILHDRTMVPLRFVAESFDAKVEWDEMANMVLMVYEGQRESKNSGSIVLPSFFSDGMVLQQNKEIRVWGKSTPGDPIKISFAGQSASAAAASDGMWAVVFPPMPADGVAYEMFIQGNNGELVIKDILLGEVWFCSGQSNMEYNMNAFADAKADSQRMDNPIIRLYKASHKDGLSSPGFDVNSSGWLTCTPESANAFSATASYFGEDLFKNINVPVGLIQSAVSGSGIQWWLQADAFSGKYIKGNGALYNELVAPFCPLSIAGVLWYQGEANANSANETVEYEDALPALVQNWRTSFKQPELPFLYVQLPRFLGNDYTRMRDSQLKALPKIKNAGMAVMIDGGEKNNIHPVGKAIVGQRLSLLAQAMVYGKNIVASGPIYKDFAVEGNKIIVTFDFVGSGLLAKDGELGGFKIFGSDLKPLEAKAQIIDTGKVAVWNDAIDQPKGANYAYEAFPVTANLYNQEGLPASPFRTYDDSITPVVLFTPTSSLTPDGTKQRTGALKIVAATASNGQIENPVAGSYDGNKDTRWAADGAQWAAYDLGAEKNVSSVAIAFFKGDERVYDFNIDVSAEGKQWSPVITGKKSTKTADFDKYSFEKEVTARYIRYTGKGSSANSWNSIMELEICGQ